MSSANVLKTPNQISSVNEESFPLPAVLNDVVAHREPSSSAKVDKAFVKKASKVLRTSKSDDAKLGPPKVVNLLRKALKFHNNAEYREVLQLALKATKIHPENAIGHHLMAMALEKLGETHKALLMYERTLELDPTEFDVYLSLGLTAQELGMQEAAEKFFRIYIDLCPEKFEGYNDLGGLLRDQNRFDDAIDIVRHALNLMPETAELWNTMGTVATETQRIEEAMTFYNEALRIDPSFRRARYNLANLQYGHGEIPEALEEFEKFIADTPPNHTDAMEGKHARAIALLTLGRIQEGWREYRVRNEPLFRASSLFATEAPLWNGENLRGKNILVIGEQGVGDEILFANPLSDLIAQVGEDGNVLISVTERLVSLFERSYPECKVASPVFTHHNGKLVHLTPWQNELGKLDYYSPMADLSIFLRPDANSYRHVGSFLKPDPEEVERWKQRLSRISDGPHVGLCWRSGFVTSGRGKFFAPLKEWGPVFETSGANFINLQYGDVTAEVEEIQTRFGSTLHQMEGLDLKEDLGSNAALCAALDVVISAPTAAAALAGSVGTKTWFVIVRRGWPSLGELDYPFYPDTEVFQQEVLGEWDSNFRDLGMALEKLVLNKSKQKSAQSPSHL